MFATDIGFGSRDRRSVGEGRFCIGGVRGQR